MLVSPTVKDLVAGSDLFFQDRGAYPLNCIDDDWQRFALSEGGSSGVGAAPCTLR